MRCWRDWLLEPARTVLMAEWLIADVSLLGIHLQLWMLLVAAGLLGWLGFVWATR